MYPRFLSIDISPYPYDYPYLCFIIVYQTCWYSIAIQIRALNRVDSQSPNSELTGALNINRAHDLDVHLILIMEESVTY